MLTQILCIGAQDFVALLFEEIGGAEEECVSNTRAGTGQDPRG
jgi:hypothetical protein